MMKLFPRLIIISSLLAFVCLIASNAGANIQLANGGIGQEHNPTKQTEQDDTTIGLASKKSSQVRVRFLPNHIKMSMYNSTSIDYVIFVDKAALTSDSSSLLVEIRPITIAPQFDILEFNRTNLTNLEVLKFPIGQLEKDNYQLNSTLNLKATYIGHARLDVKAILLKTDGTNESLMVMDSADKHQSPLLITIVKDEGTLDKVFMYSVIIFITISYINLGAQIDVDNVRRLIETPRTIFLGFLIGIIVMPAASWLAGNLLFQDQPMYRIGSFIYATAPAASASVLWTVMFNSDKELALGLQITSTIGALITMPIMLYAMDKSIDLEGQYTIKVPYMNLARTLIVLLVALLIGSRLVGRSKRAKMISQRIFRPLTMFVLLFIIVFSSIVYWYIYRMFNLTITIMALVVTCATYILSGLLGYLIHGDLDHLITISISSTYRNSGIAFAALVVAFQPPDIFIAYVPCLTQVVTTSLIGLVFLSIKSLKNYYTKI